MIRGLITKITGRSKRRQRVFLEIRPDGIAWATPDGEIGFIECSAARREQELSAAVDQHGWADAPATLVLPLDQYQVFQVERPEGIEQSELGDALKWKLKEFLDFSPSDSVSDVFAFPEDASRNRGNLVNVVAARKSLVRELIQLINACGLELVAIDIAELALSHLVARLDVNQRGAALVHIQPGHEMAQRQLGNINGDKLKAAGVNQLDQLAHKGFAGGHHVDQIATVTGRVFGESKYVGYRIGGTEIKKLFQFPFEGVTQLGLLNTFGAFDLEDLILVQRQNQRRGCIGPAVLIDSRTQFLLSPGCGAFYKADLAVRRRPGNAVGANLEKHPLSTFRTTGYFCY